MLYGRKEVQEEILGKLREFERENDRRVIFGAMVGSISKGIERYDSDYDTRFLYLDKDSSGYLRWDCLKGDIQENQIHKVYIPENNRFNRLFYDKIAFWEFTSFINFLRKPCLDGKFSVGLHHIVGWTFHSPYCWDPYGIQNKILYFLDAMCIKDYEILYYKKYIEQSMKRENCLLREYLYSVYYAIAIQYCMENNGFAPVYFPTILKFCKDRNVIAEIKKLEEQYYAATNDMIKKKPDSYQRKMANSILVSNNEIIDAYIINVLNSVKDYGYTEARTVAKDYIEDIVQLVLDSLQRPKVKDVN